MTPSKFIHSNILITLLSLLGVVIGFVSQMILAYYFGATTERDAYFSALTVPTYIVTLFTGSITATFLPYFIDFRINKSNQEVVKFVSNTLGICIVFLALIIFLMYLFSSNIIIWMASGFSDEQFLLAKNLFHILIFTTLFQSLASLITVFHHVNNRFLWPAVSPIIVPIVSTFFVLSFSNFGIVSLAWGALVGSLFSLLVLLPGVWNDIKFAHIFISPNQATVRVFILALPLLASGMFYKLTTVIERIIASRLPSGSISYLGYSNQLYVFLASIASGSIATTFYPILSTSWAEKRGADFNSILRNAIGLIILITFPIAATFLALGQPIIEMLFQRGAFDNSATQAVASCLSLLMGAFIFASLGNIIAKVFYITNRAITISVIGTVEILIYLIAAFMLSSRFSYYGLAFSLTISTGFTIVVSMFFLVKWKFVSVMNFFSDTIKILVAALLCGVTSYLSFDFLDFLPILISVSLSALIGLTIYFLLILYVLETSSSAAIRDFIKSIWDRMLQMTKC